MAFSSAALVGTFKSGSTASSAYRLWKCRYAARESRRSVELLAMLASTSWCAPWRQPWMAVPAGSSTKVTGSAASEGNARAKAAISKRGHSSCDVASMFVPVHPTHMVRVKPLSHPLCGVIAPVTLCHHERGDQQD